MTWLLGFALFFGGLAIGWFLGFTARRVFSSMD